MAEMFLEGGNGDVVVDLRREKCSQGTTAMVILLLFLPEFLTLHSLGFKRKELVLVNC